MEDRRPVTTRSESLRRVIMTTIIECRPPVAEKPAEGHQDQAKTRQPDQGFPLMPGSGQTGTLQARGLPGCRAARAAKRGVIGTEQLR
jgi:hypothetical protein